MKNIKYTLDPKKLRNMIIAGKNKINVVEKTTQVGTKTAEIETVEAGL